MRRRSPLILLVAAAAAGVLVVVAFDSGALRSSPDAARSPSLLPGTLQHTAALAGTGVDVSPAPGTNTANPRTSVSFRGVPIAQLRAVSVVGRRSGEHPGQLHRYSQGDGARFAPGSAFDAGERVDVRAVIGAGKRTTFSFRVDTPYPTVGVKEFPNPAAASRGLLLKSDLAAHTVTLVKALVSPSKTLVAESQGNALILPGGNWLVGYVRLPNLTEFDASGHVVLGATLGKNVEDFRSTLSPWSARPSTAPSIAAERIGGGVTVQASWNGATDVAGWRVLGGGSPSSLSPLASASKTGFESTVRLAAAPAYVEAQALERSGVVLATSRAIQPSRGG